MTKSTVLRRDNTPLFSVWDAVGQVIPSPAWTLKTFDTAQFNIGGAFNLATELFTAPKTGYYFFIGHMAFNGAMPAGTVGAIAFRVAGVYYHQNEKVADGANPCRLHTSGIIQLTLGDTVGLYVGQNSGVNQNSVTAFTNTNFQGQRVK